MPTIPIEIPSLLRDSAGGAPILEVKADTVRGAIDALLAAHPLLRNHLFDQTGKRRQHVLIFYNDEDINWLESLDRPLEPGDRMTVLQAVSGG